VSGRAGLGAGVSWAAVSTTPEKAGAARPATVGVVTGSCDTYPRTFSTEQPHRLFYVSSELMEGSCAPASISWTESIRRDTYPFREESGEFAGDRLRSLLAEEGCPMSLPFRPRIICESRQGDSSRARKRAVIDHDAQSDCYVPGGVSNTGAEGPEDVDTFRCYHGC
jgi:hypothetical protein